MAGMKMTSKRDLLEEIAREERLIRICEAELALERETQQNSAALVASLDEKKNVEEDEQDLLETLDALQSTSGDAPVLVESDERLVMKLLPFVGGVTFTSVKPQPNAATHKFYEFHGHVTGHTQISFVVIAGIELAHDKPQISHDQQDDLEGTQWTNKKEAQQGTNDTRSASVVSLDIKFERDSNELEQISKVASDMQSMPLLFRHFVSWADFDIRRTKLFQECQEMYGDTAVKRCGEDTIVVQIHEKSEPQCSLRLLWTYRCNWYEQGRIELSLEEFTVSPRLMIERQSEIVQWIREIRNPQGLQDLIAAVGSCEEAIRLLLRVFLGMNNR